jgi:hypothetical protein
MMAESSSSVISSRGAADFHFFGQHACDDAKISRRVFLPDFLNRGFAVFLEMVSQRDQEGR